MLNAYMFAMHGGWHFVSTLVKTWQEKLTVGAQRALRLRAISRSCGEWGPEGHTWPRCACLEIFKGFSRTTKHPNMQLFIGSNVWIYHGTASIHTCNDKPARVASCCMPLSPSYSKKSPYQAGSTWRWVAASLVTPGILGQGVRHIRRSLFWKI